MWGSMPLTGTIWLVTRLSSASAITHHQFLQRNEVVNATVSNTTDVLFQKLRFRIFEAEKNVTQAELAVAALSSNVTQTGDVAKEKYAAVKENYERLDHTNLIGSESTIELEFDVKDAKAWDEIAAKVLEISKKVKNQTSNSAQPKNITEVEKLHQKLEDATNPEKEESIDKFKIKLTEAEKALNKFEKDLSLAVHNVIHANKTMERQARKIGKQLKKMHEVHLEVAGLDD